MLDPLAQALAEWQAAEVAYEFALNRAYNLSLPLVEEAAAAAALQVTARARDAAYRAYKLAQEATR